MEHSLWYDKYRPRTLDEYVWTDQHMKAQVENWIAKRVIPSVCFAGGPGRGKTSLARLLIQQLEVDDDDVLTLRGSVDNTVETVRSKIIEFCELGGWSGLRIVFMDEADNLSQGAQQTLRNVIDDYADSVRFIFTCNYPHKIIDAIWSSRMIRIDIEKLPVQDFLNRLVSIMDAEQIDLTSDAAFHALGQIQEVCYPDLRKAINLLEDSVRDGVLCAPQGAKSASALWESYFRGLLKTKTDAARELSHIRETLLTLTPDEMEDVYRYLYHNGTELFGAHQMRAIVIINNGQKSHRQALLPDMILLEVLLKLILLMNPDE